MLLWHCIFFYFHLTLWRGSAVLRGNERENAVVFGLRGLPLSFCKGCFLSFAFWKYRAIWEEKTDLISHCTHYPRVLWRRENRGNNKICVPFATVAFVFRQPIHHRCGVSYCVVYPKLCILNCVCSLIRCWYKTLLVVFVWVLRSCLIIVSSCAFYGYWCQCVVFFMLKKPRILVCFLVVGLDLRLVVEVVYVHSLCLAVMHICRKMVCCCVLGFWFPCFLPLRTPMASF